MATFKIITESDQPSGVLDDSGEDFEIGIDEHESESDDSEAELPPKKQKATTWTPVEKEVLVEKMLEHKALLKAKGTGANKQKLKGICLCKAAVNSSSHTYRRRKEVIDQISHYTSRLRTRNKGLLAKFTYKGQKVPKELKFTELEVKALLFCDEKPIAGVLDVIQIPKGTSETQQASISNASSPSHAFSDKAGNSARPESKKVTFRTNLKAAKSVIVSTSTKTTGQVQNTGQVQKTPQVQLQACSGTLVEKMVDEDVNAEMAQNIETFYNDDDDEETGYEPLTSTPNKKTVKQRAVISAQLKIEATGSKANTYSHNSKPASPRGQTTQHTTLRQKSISPSPSGNSYGTKRCSSSSPSPPPPKKLATPQPSSCRQLDIENDEGPNSHEIPEQKENSSKTCPDGSLASSILAAPDDLVQFLNTLGQAQSDIKILKGKTALIDEELASVRESTDTRFTNLKKAMSDCSIKAELQEVVLREVRDLHVKVTASEENNSTTQAIKAMNILQEKMVKLLETTVMVAEHTTANKAICTKTVACICQSDDVKDKQRIAAEEQEEVRHINQQLEHEKEESLRSSNHIAQLTKELTDVKHELKTEVNAREEMEKSVESVSKLTTEIKKLKEALAEEQGEARRINQQLQHEREESLRSSNHITQLTKELTDVKYELNREVSALEEMEKSVECVSKLTTEIKRLKEALAEEHEEVHRVNQQLEHHRGESLRLSNHTAQLMKELTDVKHELSEEVKAREEIEKSVESVSETTTEINRLKEALIEEQNALRLVNDQLKHERQEYYETANYAAELTQEHNDMMQKLNREVDAKKEMQKSLETVSALNTEIIVLRETLTKEQDTVRLMKEQLILEHQESAKAGHLVEELTDMRKQLKKSISDVSTKAAECEEANAKIESLKHQLDTEIMQSVYSVSEFEKKVKGLQERLNQEGPPMKPGDGPKMPIENEAINAAVTLCSLSVEENKKKGVVECQGAAPIRKSTRMRRPVTKS